MAGKHSVKTSKAPIITVIAVILLIITVGVISFFISTENTDVPITETQVQTTVEQVTEVITQAETVVVETTLPVTEEQGVTSGETEPINVLVPTQEGEEAKYFNASYSPVKAVDTSTGNECSLREVFGSSYSGGTIIFNSDGTFTDQIISSRGAYAVSGEKISATYVNDKNMNITVNNWNSDTPSEFVINYGGYDVYFEG